MIKLKNINRVYKIEGNNFFALKDINLQIEKGEFLAIMGASGSGKTTLLNILGGMDVATDGEYIYEDEKIHEFKNSKLHTFRKHNISFIFQRFELIPFYTVTQNMELPMKAKNINKKIQKETVTNALTELGILECAKKYPPHLSGGQQQRCAIGRAIASGNQLLLADEPTGALDKKTGKEIMRILTRLNQQGKTIIVVTHDMEIAKHTNRIVRIEDGSIISDEELA